MPVPMDRPLTHRHVTRNVAGFVLVVGSIGLSALAGALPAVGKGKPRARSAVPVLPSPSPLFTTSSASRAAGRSVIGSISGVGGLEQLGVGTRISLRCVRGCSGAKTVRIGARRRLLQLEFKPPLRLHVGAVVELRATRSGLTGRWQRYRMVKRAHTVFAQLSGGGCLTAHGRGRCPTSMPSAGTPPTTTTTTTTMQAPIPTPAPTPTVTFVSPDDHTTVKGTVRLVANASAASGVEWQAYYAIDPTNPETVAWRAIGRDTTAADGFGLDWDTLKIHNQGSGAQGTVNIVAIALDADGALTSARDYRRVNIVNYDLTGDGYVGCADQLALMAQLYGPGTADFDGDGYVYPHDLSILLGNYYPPPGETGPCA